MIQPESHTKGDHVSNIIRSINNSGLLTAVKKHFTKHRYIYLIINLNKLRIPTRKLINLSKSRLNGV